MKHRNSEPASEGQAQENFLASASDLMAGLLLVFVILLMTIAHRFMTAAHTLDEQKREILEADRTRREMLQEIRKALEREGIKVAIDEDNGILRMPEAILFDVGHASFRAGAELKLRTLAKELEIAIPKCKALEAVFVEGHTDNAPVIGQVIDGGIIFRDNWDLSFARAKNTFQTLMKISPKLRSKKNNNKQPLFSLSAYGEERPVAPNNSKENSALNRRIELRFVLESPRERSVP